jgi:Zn-dependent protease/CBS domain-containing protein
MSANGPAGPVTRRLLHVGGFRGVPVYFAPSWVLVAALITITYNGIIYDLVDGISHSTAYVAAFGFAVLLALSVLAHELGHTAVSLAVGKPVHRVVIFLLGGVSEIDGEIERARDELLIAVAGPLVSLTLAGASGLAHGLVPGGSLAAVLLSLMAWSNLVVAVFNLLPGLPLDGGRAMRAAVWRVTGSRMTGTRIAAWGGRVVAVLVAGAAVALDVDGVNWSVGTGLFGLALGAFIWIGATQALRFAEMQNRLPLLSTRSLLRPGLLVPADVPVAEALRRAEQSNARGLVVVDGADQPRAIVDEIRLGALPAEQRPWVTVSEVSRPLEPGMVLSIALSGERLLDALRGTPAREYLVVHEDGSLAGILSATDLVAELTRSAL